MNLVNVAQFIFGINKMITREEVAIVLDRQGFSANLTRHTFLRPIAKHHGNHVFKLVDKDLPKVFL